MKRLLAIVLALVFILAGSVDANTLHAPRGFAGQLYKGTLALYARLEGQDQFVCTTEPFEKIPGGYHLISAGHCVQLMPIGVQFFVADDIGGPLTPVKMLKAYFGGGTDFSEFELQTKRKYPVFVLGDEHNARVGDRTINPNFSAGVAKQLSLGYVSSDILGVTSRCPVDDCAGDFIVQSFDAGGASGSAVISARTHEVIGLIVIEFGANIGFGAEPISKFKKFLAGPNQPHPVETEDQ
jgi:hypothetical protein